MERAAISTSLSVDSAPVGKTASPSTAMRVAPGANSRRSSSRFADTSDTKKLTPVKLPLGRARLVDQAQPDRVLGGEKDNRDGRGCRLGGDRCGRSGRGDYRYLTTN